MSVLMVALKFVKAYLDDLLYITRASLEDHLEKLSEVLTRLREMGLKINAQSLNSVPKKQSTWDMYSQQMVLNRNNKKGTSNPHTSPANWSQRPL
jgi:hypothetical protein